MIQSPLLENRRRSTGHVFDGPYHRRRPFRHRGQGIEQHLDDKRRQECAHLLSRSIRHEFLVAQRAAGRVADDLKLLKLGEYLSAGQ